LKAALAREFPLMRELPFSRQLKQRGSNLLRRMEAVQEFDFENLAEGSSDSRSFRDGRKSAQDVQVGPLNAATLAAGPDVIR
jgi:hypothetical protein